MQNLKLKIQSIQIKGFKSFYQKEIIEFFDPNFSVICGPNGSGKSTILEAICFVLGVNPSDIRTKNQENLINEKIISSKNNQKCSASVVLNCALINSENKIMKKIFFKRKIFQVILKKRSKNKNHSEKNQIQIQNKFSIKKSNLNSKSNNENTGKKRKKENRNSSSFKEIKKKELMRKYSKYGIDPKFLDRFVVFQHKTSNFVEKGNKSLCTFLEKIIGTESLKNEIEEKDKEIQEINRNILELSSKINQIEKDRAILQPKVESWNNYQKERSNLFFMRKNYFTIQMKRNLSIIQGLNNENENLEEERRKIEKKSQNKDKEMKQIKKKLKEEENIKNEEESKIFENWKNVNQISSEIGKKEALDSKLKNDIKKKKGNIQDLEGEMTNLQEKQKELKIGINKMKEEIDSLEKKKETKTNQIEKKKQIELELFQLNIRDGFQEMEKKIENHLKKKQKWEEEKAILENETKKESKLMQKQKEIEKKKMEETNRKEKEREEMENKNSQLESQIQKKEEDLSELEKKKKRKEMELKENHQQSLSEQMINELKRGNPGIYGFFKDLGRINKKYLIALNSVLKNNLSTTILVESREAASEVISVFRKKKIGIVKCQILNELQSPPIQNNLKSKGFPLFSYIECEDKFAPFFYRFLRNWNIVEDRKDIPQSHHSQNFVLLNGDLYFSDGEISTGFLVSKRNNRMKRFEIKDKQIRTKSNESLIPLERSEKIEFKIQEMRKSILDLQSVIFGLKEEKENTQNIIKEISSDLRTMKGKLSKISQKIRDYELDLEIKQRDSSCLNEKYEILGKDEKGINFTEYQNLKERKEKLEEALVSCLDTKELLNSKRKKLSKKEGILLNLKAEMKMKQNLKNKKEEQLDQKKQEKKKIDELVDELKNKEKEVKKNLRDMKEFVLRIEKEIREMKREWEKKGKEREDLGNHKAKIENEMENKRMLKTQMEEEMKEVEKELERIEKEINQGEMGKEKEKRRERETEKSLEEKEKRIEINNLEKDLSLQKEKKKLESERRKLKMEWKKHVELRDKLEANRFELFDSSMKEINEELSKIYREINAKSGDCFLQYSKIQANTFLEGVSFHIKPDNTTWKMFRNLSGGQKALATLALTLSLQKKYSSPIFVWDEFDSSLDVSTIDRVGKFISKISQNENSSQFIVVSHSSQMYEKAHTLIGIFHHQETTKSVCLKREK
ncbi:structural maintenance of chromosomes smc family member [Anaeramoeba ignava]|uniref:Structural maintenance of chromosomes protein n=1 Tax=Anaeramoeba ignava TaxID=1746090 RepID=A0A9Q0RAC7_ANAIG|nr:structural maintenance of chromosomes smc family member [Anaeramoeba ignava]